MSERKRKPFRRRAIEAALAIILAMLFAGTVGYAAYTTYTVVNPSPQNVGTTVILNKETGAKDCSGDTGDDADIAPIFSVVESAIISTEDNTTADEGCDTGAGYGAGTADTASTASSCCKKNPQSLAANNLKGAFAASNEEGKKQVEKTSVKLDSSIFNLDPNQSVRNSAEYIRESTLNCDDSDADSMLRGHCNVVRSYLSSLVISERWKASLRDELSRIARAEIASAKTGQLVSVAGLKSDEKSSATGHFTAQKFRFDFKPTFVIGSSAKAKADLTLSVSNSGRGELKLVCRKDSDKDKYNTWEVTENYEATVKGALQFHGINIPVSWSATNEAVSVTDNGRF